MKVFLCLTVLVVVAQMAMGSAIPMPKVYPVIPRAYAVPPARATHRQAPAPTERAVAGCGKANTPAGRIVDGTEAIPNEFPWVVALFLGSGSFCTGSLISDEWVITAAHCADGQTSVDVYLGAHNVRLADEPGRLILKSNTLITHPNWNSNTLQGDIALIKLPEKVDITGDKIRPICLQPTNLVDDFVGDTVNIAGWGKTADGPGSISPTLQKATQTVIDNPTCQNTYGALLIRDNIMCTTDSEYRPPSNAFTGTCNGDSGSSLSWINSDDGLYYQVGVTSFVSSAGCSSGNPDGFTRYQSYNAWVLEQTGLTA
jgi:secreted trypsin-like serine protease